MGKNKVFDKLRNYFNIGFKKSAKEVENKIFPLKTAPDEKQKNLKKGDVPVKMKDVFPSNVQELFNWWVKDNHYSMDSWKSRKKLWDDCYYMFMNSPIMARAAELIADEVVQADIGTQPILIEAKRKQKKFIQDLFDKTNLYSFLRPTALSLAQYGNSGWVLSFDENGVDEIIPRNVYGIHDRMEFSPYRVKELISAGKNNILLDFKNKIDRIDQLIDMITNKDNVASYFKDYLFGFVVDDYALPPWRFLHFRHYTLDSPFVPFGTPLFVHSIAPYMQLDAGMTIQIAARGASFPKDVYRITLPEAMPPSEKVNSALEFCRELQNSGINAVVKERDGVGEVVITIDGLYEYSQESPDFDLDKIADLEMMRDDLIISTQLPRNIIDPNDSSFGDSGVSLIEKFKPFARLVYRLQTAMLENISQLVKIHMIHSGEFALDEMDFILKMPYPESQVNDELIRSQSDLLSLSNDIIDALSDKFMDGDPLPSIVVKDIYSKLLPYDDKTLDNWVKEIEKANSDGSEDSDKENKLEEHKLIERWTRKKNENTEKFNETYNDVIFEKKQSILREGSIRGYHYYSSKNKYQNFPAELLVEIDKKRASKGVDKKKLNEKVEEFKVPKNYKVKTKKR